MAHTSQEDDNDSRVYHNVSPLPADRSVSQQSSAKMVRKSILDLFLNVKIRSQEEIAAMDENAIELEKEKLKNVDTIDLIDYIKQSVEILMHMRMEEFELFKQNWETQERIRKAKLKEEKDNLKKKVTKERAQTCNTKFFDKLKHELLSNDS